MLRHASPCHAMRHSVGERFLFCSISTTQPFSAMSSTPLDALPADPLGGGPSTTSSGAVPPSNVPGNASVSLDPSTIQQIVSSLQQASLSGATQLPSRDIPQNTGRLTSDPEVQANYIPPAPARDPTLDAPSREQIVGTYQRKQERRDWFEEIAHELHIPFLLAILYFLFQLPTFRKYITQFLPYTTQADGNFNTSGMLTLSILFGGVYYGLERVMNLPTGR